MSLDFSLYLESIRCHDARRQIYTLTDVVGQTAQREATFPLLGLMVQTIGLNKVMSSRAFSNSQVRREAIFEIFS